MIKSLSKKVAWLLVFMMVFNVIMIPNFAEATDAYIGKTESESYIKAVASGASDIEYMTITTYGGVNEYMNTEYDNVARGNIMITFPSGTNLSNVDVNLAAQNGFGFTLGTTTVNSGSSANFTLDLTQENIAILDVYSDPNFIEGSYVITGAIEDEMITVITEINIDNPRDWLNGDYIVPTGYRAPTPGQYPYISYIQDAIDGFDNGEPLIFTYNVPVGTTAMDVLRNFDTYHNMDITGLDSGYISYMGRNGYNQIGEFDINYYSGWMYTIDEGAGWYFPNVGASAKTLTDDTSMIWHFTMAYGADIGAPWAEPGGETPGGGSPGGGYNDVSKVQIEYLTSPLKSDTDLTARITVSAKQSENTKKYRAETYCSWDNKNWIYKGGGDITINPFKTNGFTDLKYSVSSTGNLYTRVVLYDSITGNRIGEYVKQNPDTVYPGDSENYDWYEFSFTDENNKTVEGYISGLGSKLEESSEDIYAIALEENDIIWKQYKLSGKSWNETGTTYASNPFEDIVVAGRVDIDDIQEQDVSIQSLPSIKDIKNEIKRVIANIEKEFYNSVGFDINELTNKDKKMVLNGIACGVDDNMFWGFAQYITGAEQRYDDYFFMKAKCYTDAAFLSAYTVVAVGSAAEAVNALKRAGLSAKMAIATSPTGAGTAVLGTATVAQLAESVVMAGVSFVASKMAENSGEVLKRDVDKLPSTKQYNIEVSLKDIEYKNKKELTAEEVNQWWEQYGTLNPYKSNTTVYQITLSKNTKFVRVYSEESRIRGSWIMKAEDIKGLTPSQIKDKFALPSLPKYVCDVNLPSNTTMRVGIVGEQVGFGGLGGGIQYDLMRKEVGQFINQRLLP